VSTNSRLLVTSQINLFQTKKFGADFKNNMAAMANSIDFSKMSQAFKKAGLDWPNHLSCIDIPFTGCFKRRRLGGEPWAGWCSQILSGQPSPA
jgi:hypothetical protein